MSGIEYEAAGYINKALSEHQRDPTLLLVSGGSALKVAEYINTSLCGGVTVALIDERITPRDADRNMKGLEEAGLLQYGGLSAIPIEQTGTPEAIARRYERDLKQWVKDHAHPYIFALLGMGPDGHTASLFPGYRFSGTQWVIAVHDVRNNIPDRISVSPYFLTHIVDDAVLYFTGEEKRNAYANIRTLPAGIIYRMKKVGIFTDLGPASTLES